MWHESRIRRGLGRAVTALAVASFLSPAAAAPDVLGYDPDADPFALLAAARAEAAGEDKRVLVIAGGEWCIWCHYLDAFLEANADVAASLKETFVVVKAHLGDANMNEAFFATLPEAVGYPHFWVIGADGSVLASQNTLPLEDGDKSYDRERFLEFIGRWATAR